METWLVWNSAIREAFVPSGQPGDGALSVFAASNATDVAARKGLEMPPMKANQSNLRSILIGSLAGAVGLGAILALDEADKARIRLQFQEIADDAAISGVLVLADSVGPAEKVQHEAAVAATNQVTSRIPDARSTVTPSTTDKSVSVHLSAAGYPRLFGLIRSANPINVVGTASYVPPRQPQTHLTNRLDWKLKHAPSRLADSANLSVLW